MKKSAMARTRETPAMILRFDEISMHAQTGRDARRQRRIEEQLVKEKTQDKVFAAVAIAIMIAVALSTVLAHNAKEEARFAYAYELPRVEVIVSQGDTIDGIASENPVSGLSDHELGIVISDINKGNPNKTIPIRPGDRIWVPIER